MTTIAAGANATITVAAGGSVSIASSGGLWTSVETPVGGTPRSVIHGPTAHTRVFGPFVAGATLVLTNQTVAGFTYIDYEVPSVTLGTIAVGAASTFTLTPGGSVTVNNPAGLWQVTVTPAIGSPTTAVYGPAYGNMGFGPYPAGATVVVTNQTGSALVTSQLTAAGGSAGVAVTITTQLDAGAVIQRLTKTGGGQGKGQGSVAMALSFTGTQPIYCRRRSASDGVSIVQAAWLANASATSGTITLAGIDAPAINAAATAPVAANDGAFFLDVATDPSGPWTNGTSSVMCGRLTAVSGQSLAVRMLGHQDGASGTNTSLGVTITPYCSMLATYNDTRAYMPTVATMPWAPPADGGNYDSTFTSEFLRRQVQAFGVACGVIGHAQGGTAVTTYWSGGTNDVTFAQVVAKAGGAWESEIFYQGHTEAAYGLGSAAYQASLTTVWTRHAALNSLTATKYTGSVPNIGSSTLWGTPFERRRIRKAHADYATANGATHVQISDLEQIDTIHENQPGAITMARHFHRATRAELALRTDLGPALVSASRVGTTITLTLSDVGQSTLVLTGTPANRIHVFSAGRYDQRAAQNNNRFPVSTVTVTNKTTLSIVLANDPGDGHTLNLFFAWPNELTLTPQNDMIRDDLVDGDGITVGRQVVPNIDPVVIAPPGSGVNAPPSGFIAGTSPWNMTPTSAAYGAQEQTGFNQTMSDGRATATANATPSMVPYTVDCWFTYLGVPAATQVLVGGLGGDFLGINTSGHLAGPSSIVGTAALVAGKRYHVRMQRGPLGTQFYLTNVTDATAGTRDANSGTAVAATVSPATMTIRSHLGSFILLSTTATVDEVALFETVLTTPGNTTYTAPTTPYVGNEAGLVGLYHLDGDVNEAVVW